MSDLKRRTTPRFALRYRAQVDYSLDGTKYHLECVIKNVSLGGALFESPALIPLNCPVEFVIPATAGRVIRQIEFKGKGDVVRVQPDPLGSGFVIAVRCAEPICFHREEINSGTSRS